MTSQKPRIVALLPMKANSERVKGKNFRLFNGKPLFSCALEPAISANPYVQFSARIDEAGTFKFAWTDDDGTVITAEEKIALKA